MHSPNGLRAILFDLDGTLRHDQPGGVETFLRFARELGLKIGDEAARRGERWTYDYWADSPELKTDIAAFGEGTDAFWLNHTVRHLRVMGVSGLLQEYAAAIRQRFVVGHQPGHHVPDDVAPTLRALGETGYVVGLVSNRTDPLTAICQELGLFGLFDFTLSAGEAGASKPARGIFDRAAEIAGVPNAAAAYVGDNYYADVLGAANAGLRPVLIDPRRLFPEAECTVVRSVGEVPEALG